MGLEKMRLHSADEFESWLAIDMEILEELEALMGIELGVDEQSLDPLESFLLQRFRTPDEALTLEQRGVLDAAARQVGLVMVLGVDDARWDINLDDPEDIYYRLPVVRFRDGAADCPLTAVTTALDRRTGNLLRSLVEGYEELYDTEGSEGAE